MSKIVCAHYQLPSTVVPWGCNLEVVILESWFFICDPEVVVLYL